MTFNKGIVLGKPHRVIIAATGSATFCIIVRKARISFRCPSDESPTAAVCCHITIDIEGSRGAVVAVDVDGVDTISCGCACIEDLFTAAVVRLIHPLLS